MTPALQAALSLGMAALLLLSCQPWPAPIAGAGGTPRLTLGDLPATLTRPRGLDWTAQAITSRRILASRGAHLGGREGQHPAAERRLLAFPTAAGGWAAGPGVSLASLGDPYANDSVPNGAASSFYGGTVSSLLFNQLFFLTRRGVFLKVAKAAPATGAVALDLAGGAKTFSRTHVTLSPSCSRAYVLADDGTFYVINTVTMQTMATVDLAGAATSVAVSGGRGIAPVIDPFTSAYNDARDNLYIPGNDGRVTHVQIQPGATATQVVVSAGATYTLAIWATTAGAPHRFMAPGLVLAGTIYIGDTAGNFYAYNTLSPGDSTVFDLGDPVTTMPTIELQDGTAVLTNPAGDPVSVPPGTPIYAFANAGRACQWINLFDGTVNGSLDLYVDDNDGGQHYGYLIDYKSSTSNIGRKLFAIDSVTMSTDGTVLPGLGAARTTNFLAPATSLLAGGAGAAVTYLRWSDPTAISDPVVISKATLQLQCYRTATSPPLRLHETSPFYKGSATSLWTSGAVTAAAGATERPSVGADVGKYASGGLKNGVVKFNQGTNYKWNAARAWSGQLFGSGATPTHLAVALVHPASANTIFWGGPTAPAAGSYWGTPFYGSAGTAGAQRPKLDVTYTAYNRYPFGQVLQTPPVIDVFHRKVYVLNGNQVFALDYSSPDAFTEADYDWVAKTGTKYTLFNETTFGIQGGSGGGMYDGKKSFIFNMSAPLMNYDGTALYALNMYPNLAGGVPTSWDTTLSKLRLPLNASGLGNQLVGATTVVKDVPSIPVAWRADSAILPNAGSGALLLDPYENETSIGGGVYFGLGNGRIYQYEP